MKAAVNTVGQVLCGNPNCIAPLGNESGGLLEMQGGMLWHEDGQIRLSDDPTFYTDPVTKVSQQRPSWLSQWESERQDRVTWRMFSTRIQNRQRVSLLAHITNILCPVCGTENTH